MFFELMNDESSKKKRTELVYMELGNTDWEGDIWIDLEWLIEFYQVEKSKNETPGSDGSGVFFVVVLLVSWVEI